MSSTVAHEVERRPPVWKLEEGRRNTLVARRPDAEHARQEGQSSDTKPDPAVASKRPFDGEEDDDTREDARKRVKLQEVRGTELRQALDDLKAKHDNLFSSHAHFMKFAKHLMASPLDVIMFLALKDQPLEDLREWVDDCLAVAE